MKKTLKILFLIQIVLSVQVFSQTDVDALRYSMLLHGGTARYNAMGGAFSALGADFSVLSTNPAGIGFYKNSEISFSPSVFYNKTTSNYLSQSSEDFKYNFNFNNVGMVFSGKLGTGKEKAEWKNIQFGFGVNKLQNFNTRSIIEGYNDKNTILDVLSARAQGTKYTNLDPFSTELAFNTYLLDTAGSANNYIQALYGGSMQRKSITTSGGVNEMLMTLGGNFDDKLYIGATLGFPFVRYEEISSYKEIDTDNKHPNFQSLTINNNLETNGTGFNFKFGMIYRINDWVRISGAFHTPTFYSMTDTYSISMKSDLENKGTYSDKSPTGKYDYNLMTPMKVIGGLAFVISPYGSLSAEYEMIDYSQARLREKDVAGTFDTQNEAITDKYTATGNLRIGTEWVFAPFCVRAGYAMYGNPYKSNLNDASENIISAGLGLREKKYFLDFTFMQSLSEQDYYLYPTVPTSALMKYTKSQFVLTYGIKF